MGTLRLLLLVFAIASSSTLFAQNGTTVAAESKFQDIVIADYTTMNLGPKLNQLTSIRIFSDQINDRSNSGSLSAEDFVSTWLLYQSDVLIINHSEYDNESAEDRQSYDDYHTLVIANDRPTLAEILSFTKK